MYHRVATAGQMSIADASNTVVTFLLAGSSAFSSWMTDGNTTDEGFDEGNE